MREQRIMLSTEDAPKLGCWIGSPDLLQAERLANVGWDFVIIDGEHATLSVETIAALLVACTLPHASRNPALFVRLSSSTDQRLGAILDAGAHGVVVPRVGTASQAAEVIMRCNYPPDGTRGVGSPRRAYLGVDERPESTIVLIQIEDALALEHLDEIISVPRIDGVLIGRNDLAASMGHFGRPDADEVMEATRTVIDSCRTRHVPVGLALGPEPASLDPWRKQGLSFITLGDDASFMTVGAMAAYQASRGWSP